MTMRSHLSGQGGGAPSPVIREIAAAKALDWNVELDRGLRSGAQAEAAMRLGPRLLKLSQEPVVAEITAALYKLEPGQDQVLANAIVRRLADAFQSGSNFTRLCILKVFLLEYKGRKKSKASRQCSLFTKERIPNFVEFLRRIKSVLDSGDPTARALALRVIGCLAELASDSVEVYRLVLEALQSPHCQEVEGAFFAMSCLCEVSVAFSAQALKKVTALVNAMETAPESKRLAVKLFAKMNLTPQLSLEAHEVGRKLMSRLPTEDVVRTMLVALTHLATQALETMDQQVKLLLSYVNSDPRSNVRAVALNCLNKLVPKATTFHSLTRMDFQLLLSILGDPDLPAVLHVSALQLVQKLLRSYIGSADAGDMEELVGITELCSLHGDWSIVRASLSLLVDLSCSLAKPRDGPLESNQDGANGVNQRPQKITHMPEVIDVGYVWDIDLPTRVSLLICDQVASAFVEQCNIQERGKLADTTHPQVKDGLSSLDRCRTLCSLLARLGQGCPHVGYTIVDYISGVLEGVFNRTVAQALEKQADKGSTDMDVDGTAGASAGPVLQEDAENEKVLMAATLKMVHILCRSLLAFVNILREDDTAHLVCSRLCKLTTLLANFEQSGDILMALLPAVLRACMNQHHNSLFSKTPSSNSDQVQDINDAVAVSPSSIDLEQVNINISKVTEKMKIRRKYWAVYKVGVLSASMTRWQQAESAFVVVQSKVSSEGLYLWLEALVLVSRAEAEVGRHETNAMVSSNRRADENKDDKCGDVMDVDKGSKTTGATVQIVNSNSTTSTHVDQQLDGSRNALRNVFAEGAVRCIPLLQNASRTLGAGVSLERTFEFQRWFLSLRCTMLKRVAELIGLLEIGSLDLVEPERRPASNAGSKSVFSATENSELWQTASRLQAIAEKADWIASEFKRLSEEFDVLCLSFMGMDTESLQILSQASLNCSLLAFCIVSLLFPKLPGGNRDFTSTHVDLGLAAYDLLQRLEQMTGDEWEELTTVCMEHGAFFGTGYGLRSSYGPVGGPHLLLCRWAIRELVHLSQKAAQEGQSMTRPWLQFQGLSLLKSLLDNWSLIPWLVPRFFFITRPRAGFEVMFAQLGGSDMSINAGSALSLGLAFQLVHLPPKTSVKSISCALTVQLAKTTVTTEEDSYAGWRISWHEGKPADQLFDVALIEELVLRERGSTIKGDSDNSETQVLARSVLSLPVDESGRGFASCIIDVRKLPIGVYHISVHCVCSERRGAQWSLLSPRSCPTFKII